MIDYTDYISGISFRFIRPHMAPPRGFSTFTKLLGKLGVELEIINTRLPHDEQTMKASLREVCKIPKMSTFAIGAMINKGVSQMPDNQVFVNVGVWQGFTLLAGMVNNAQKKV